MEYKGEGIEALVAAVDAVENANLINVDRKVKSLLKCLAYYSEFRAVIEYCAKGADYPAEKRKALIQTGDYKTVRLPQTPSLLIVLCVGLLTEFDSGTTEILDFCSEWFPASSQQDSLIRFCAELLDPFKFAINNLVVDGIKEEVVMAEREVQYAHDGLQQQAEYLLVAFVKGVDESSLPEKERSELLTMLEGLSAALDSRDVLMIKAIWLGTKRAIASNGQLNAQIKKMDELLRLYLVAK